MRDYAKEFKGRVQFIKEMLKNSGASGIVFGNSGGKDSALVGILCKAACDNTLGLIMPCASRRNFGSDRDDGIDIAEKFGIAVREIDLTPVRDKVLEQLNPAVVMTPMAIANLAPRLRMLTLYAIGAAENRLVAGTSNFSESYMGYFTKWGDGASDFNPIADLKVTEVYEFLEYLGAPESIRTKAPSGGLFDGQTDEKEMGVSYDAIDRYIATGEAEPGEKEIIERYHRRSGHKREPIAVYRSPDR